MRLRALLTAACFLALAVTATLVVASVTRPSTAGVLAAAALLATVAGGAGLLRRRAWPLALLLVPLGAYLLARFQIGLPAEVDGLRAHVGFYAGKVASGAALYSRETFPLDGGAASLRLLVSLAVYIVVAAAAFLALSLRRPLPGIVILLCLAGFGFTTDETARQPLAAVAFVVFAGGLLALSRPRHRERARAADAVAGGVTAVVAAVLAFSVLGATSVEAGRPLQDWRAWNLAGPGTELLQFDWMQNYPRLLDREDDAVVMEVRSPVATYWRANVLSQFDGAAWRGTTDAFPLQPSLSDGVWTYEVPRVGRATPGRTVTQRFYVRNTYTDHLFAGGSPLEIAASLPLDLSTSGAGAVSVDPPRGPKLAYSVTASVPDIAPMDLIGRGKYYPREVEDAYLTLPFAAREAFDGPDADERWETRVGASPWGSEWTGLYDLNQRIVGDQSDPYRVALAIQQYLRTNYDYSLTPPPSDYGSPYAAFLFQTLSGYCQHFAGTMAVLLRFNGIPARVAVGFTQGQEEREGVYVVRRHNAHAWVEAYFPGAGWAPFDPTPGRSLPASADVTPDGESTASSDEAGGGANGAGLPDVLGRARVNDPGGPGTASAVTLETPDRRPWLLLALAVLLAWPAGRALLRRRGLFGGTADERLRASVGLLYAALRDHGVDVPASQTLDETARLLRDRFGVDAGDVPTRVQAVLFGGRAATDADVAAVRALERRLRASLRSRDGRLAALAAAYGLRRARPAHA